MFKVYSSINTYIPLKLTIFVELVEHILIAKRTRQTAPRTDEIQLVKLKYSYCAKMADNEENY